MRTVDARGLPCPKPIIETKKALKEVGKEQFAVLIDNETSLGNVCKFLIDNNCRFDEKYNNGFWILTVSPSGVALSDKSEEDYCSIKPHEDSPAEYVIALTSEFMGQGSDELGAILMKSFVNILTELDKLPAAVVCYNSGVKLALPGSPVVETLAELEKRGVEVILCGTCIDFFGLRGRTIAGKTGDMFLIAGLMAAARSVLKP
jgi:selenium metabolism protein YedF